MLIALMITMARESEMGYSMTAPIVLSVIAGALILTSALLPLIWYYYMPMGMMQGRGMMGMYSWPWQWWQMQWIGIPFASIVGLISGSLVILGSVMLGNRQHEYRVWGTLILVSSIVSLLGMGGFIVGSILGMIGGALALSRRG